MAAALGLLFAAWTADLLPSFFPPEQAVALEASPGLRVFLFAIVVAVIAAAIVGVLPATRAVRPALASTLRGGAGDIVDPGASRSRSALVDDSGRDRVHPARQRVASRAECREARSTQTWVSLRVTRCSPRSTCRPRGRPTERRPSTTEALDARRVTARVSSPPPGRQRCRSDAHLDAASSRKDTSGDRVTISN